MTAIIALTHWVTLLCLYYHNFAAKNLQKIQHQQWQIQEQLMLMDQYQEQRQATQGLDSGSPGPIPIPTRIRSPGQVLKRWCQMDLGWLVWQWVMQLGFITAHQHLWIMLCWLSCSFFVSTILRLSLGLWVCIVSRLLGYPQCKSNIEQHKGLCIEGNPVLAFS